VALSVPVFDVMVNVMLVKVTPTTTGAILSGHVRLPTPTGAVETTNVPLPDRVGNGSEPVVVLLVVCSPFGAVPLLPRLTHPVVTFASADRVAVAVLPAPATSPVARRYFPLVPEYENTVGPLTKWSPPVCVTGAFGPSGPPTRVSPSAAVAVARIAATTMAGLRMRFEALRIEVRSFPKS
jgi:hypothetical protein